MFKVGQKLWFVRNEKRSGAPMEVTVQSVGRKWFQLDFRLRCDASGLVDGGQYQSPGHCYISKEAYELECARLEVWWKFKRSLEYKPMPDSLTIEELAQISATLKI